LSTVKVAAEEASPDTRGVSEAMTENTGEAGHSAAASALGYVFQVEIALVELVRRARSEPSTRLTIERYDDVAFDSDGTPRELLQTKHHISGVGDLTDRSRDLWRTLRVWIDAIRTGDAIIPGSTFSLLTTAVAPDGSATSMLRPAARNVDAAAAALELVASTGGQQANANAYEAFLRLSPDERLKLLEAVVILDRSPGLVDVSSLLVAELGWALRPHYRDQLVDRLVQWWDRRVFEHLRTGQQPIEAEEVFYELDAIRDEFTADALPVDVSIEDAETRELGEDERAFVYQLQLLAMSHRGLELAIRDFKRAYMQRSRWLDDALVSSRELRRYEARLVDEWQHLATPAWDDLEEDDADRLAAGRALYERIQVLDLWIRANCQERFVVRGSYHMLANELKVGWHPDFIDRLRDLLGPAAA
jgi:hypothetical protein